MILSALHHEDQNKTYKLEPTTGFILPFFQILSEGYSVLWANEMERGQKQLSAAQSFLTQSTFNLMCSHSSAWNTFITSQTEDVKSACFLVSTKHYSALFFSLGFVFLLSNLLFSEKVGTRPWNAGGF